jgi:hypothetical protein
VSNLDNFEAITLEDLNARAQLLVRRDRKYLLPHVSDVEELMGALPHNTRALEIDGGRVFEYRTVYFDTPDMLSYHLTASRHRRRFKVRTRGYASGETWLEVKTRGVRGITIKDRIGRLDTAPDAKVLWDTAARLLAERGVAAPPLESLTEMLEVRYSRSTLLLDGGRATIDTNIRWGRPGELEPAGDFIVVETKTPGTRTPLDRELWLKGRRPLPFSKFGVGMASTYDLSGNRWHRLMKRIQEGALS